MTVGELLQHPELIFSGVMLCFAVWLVSYSTGYERGYDDATKRYRGEDDDG